MVRTGPVHGSSSRLGIAWHRMAQQLVLGIVVLQSRPRAGASSAEESHAHPLLRGTQRPESCRRTSSRSRLQIACLQESRTTIWQEILRRQVRQAPQSTFLRARRLLGMAGRLLPRSLPPVKPHRLQRRHQTPRHRCKCSFSTSRNFARCTVPRRLRMP